MGWAFVKNMTINNKLLFIIMATCSISLLLVTLSIMLFQILSGRSQVERDQEAFAAIIGASCVPALDFEQPRDAQLILEGLAQKPSITFAAIYNANHELFAAYRRSDLKTNYVPHFKSNLREFRNNRHYLNQPILSQGEVLGTITLITDLAEMKSHMLRNLTLLLLVLCFAAFIALVVSTRLRRVISEPIMELAAITMNVSRGQDFTQRATVRGSDEIGTLVQGFNQMMDRIEDQKQALEDEKQALYESEKKYRGIFENATEGIFQVNQSGQFMTVNHAFTSMLGFKHPQDLMQRYYKAALVFAFSDDRESFLEQLSSRGFTRNYETRLLCEDQSHIHVSMNAHRVQDEDARGIFFEGTVQDNTQRIRAEHLASAKEEAEAATRAKSAFLANMSHEIRTPMNAIIGLTNLVLGSELAPKIRNYLGMINDASTSLLNIINDILDFSKVEAGKLSVEKVRFSLSHICDQLANIFRTTSALKNIELLFDVSPEIPASLLGDPLRITQVLTNLVNNALKFTEEGEVVVRIALDSMEGQTAKVAFHVSDTGIGIPQQKLKTLFDSFTQADNSHSRKYGGTGLGLAICRDLVHLMNGTIEVVSNPKAGSIFTFRLSLPVDTTAGAERTVSFNNATALLVNNRPIAGELMRNMLIGHGLQITHLENADTALEFLHNAPSLPRILIVDCVGEMNRVLGFVNQIRSQWNKQQLPMILTASMEQSELESIAKKAGADAVLIKPISQSQLLDTIGDLLTSDYVARLVASSHQGWDLDTPSHIRGAKILLVEDNEVNRIVACDLLRTAGLTVDAVISGTAALRAIMETRYDAVLMDIQMPDMDGYQATEAIRSNPRFADLPIIAMTAHATRTDRDQCLARGMNDHVAKPINPTVLFKALARFVAVPAHFDLFPLKSDGIFPAELEGIHLTSALNRIGGDEHQLKRALIQFEARFRDAVPQIKAALSVNNSQGAKDVIHSLKGASGNISAMAVYTIAATVETELNTGAQHISLGQLDMALTTVIRTINQLPQDIPVHALDKASVSLEEGLRQLSQLLATNDFDAEEQLEQLAATFSEGDIGENLRKMLLDLRNLDFKEARAKLASVAVALGITLNT